MRKHRIRRIALLCLLAGLLLTGCTVKREASQWQVHHDQAMDELRDGYYDEAIANFTAAIEADPMKAESYAGRGQAYLTYPTARTIWRRPRPILSRPSNWTRATWTPGWV